MTSKVGPKGQVVIPKHMRDELGIEPGDLVTFVVESGGVRVEPLGGTEPLLGRFAGLDLVGTLEADRRSEPR